MPALFSSGDFSFVINMLEQATDEQAINLIEKDSINIITEAQNFRTAYDILVSQEEALQKEQIAQLKIAVNNPTSKNFTKGLRGGQKAYITRAKYLLAFNFDQKLNTYLSHLPTRALYVFNGGGVNSTYEMSLQELAKHIDAEGRIKFSENLLSSLVEQEKASIIEESKEEAEWIEHVRNVQTVYQQVVNQMNMSEKSQGAVIAWKTQKETQYAKIINKGDLKEAYVAALMAEHKSQYDIPICRGKDQDISSNIFYFYDNYISKVTNEAAIVEEDVVSHILGKQFSVKSGKAEAPGLAQYLTTADKIIQGNLIDMNAISSMIKETFASSGVGRNILIDITEAANRVGEEVLAKLI